MSDEKEMPTAEFEAAITEMWGKYTVKPDVWYNTSQMSDLSDVTILITSFLRHGYLRECLLSVRKHLPECSTVVVDDSREGVKDYEGYSATENNEYCVCMPFDSGLSAKRNAGVKICETKYLLLGCDDFLFDPEARKGIERMVDALDNVKHLDLVGGRVDHRSYEGYVEYNAKEGYIKETRLDDSGMRDGDIVLCDLTVNYFLARTEVLKQFSWPEEMRIGGEHICLFLDLKLAGRKVAFVKGANINTQPYDPSKQDPRYAEFRARARSLGHPLMKKRYNIERYIGFEGDVS